MAYLSKLGLALAPPASALADGEALFPFALMYLEYINSIYNKWIAIFSWSFRQRRQNTDKMKLTLTQSHYKNFYVPGLNIFSRDGWGWGTTVQLPGGRTNTIFYCDICFCSDCFTVRGNSDFCTAPRKKIKLSIVFYVKSELHTDTDLQKKIRIQYSTSNNSF